MTAKHSDDPHVSVLIPVFNAESHPEPVEEMLESILCQSYDNFDVVLVDDASTDGTRQRIQAFVDALGGVDRRRFHVVGNRHNLGVAGATNVGLDWIDAHLGSTDFVARLDSDDRMLPERLESQILAMGRLPDVDVLSANVRCRGINANGTRVDQALVALTETDLEIKTRMFFACPLHHTTVMFRYTSLEKRSWRYREIKGLHEDYDLWCRMAAAGLHFYSDPAVLGVYTIRPDSETILQDRVASALRVQSEMFASYFRDYLNIWVDGREWIRYVQQGFVDHQIQSIVHAMRVKARRGLLDEEYLELYLDGFRW